MTSKAEESTEVKQDKASKELQKSVPCFCSQRWILAYLTFFGFTCVFALRTNISVAVVCMVKSEITSKEILSNGSYVNKTATHSHDSCLVDGIDPSINTNAEFDWNKTLMSSILASFFYGYIVTQIPGGWLADRFGGKKVFGIGMLISAISAVLLPVCARQSYIFVFVLRIITGLALGVCYPAVLSMWGRWAPPLERTKLTSFIQLGAVFGMFGTWSSGGVLCDYGFDNGWGSIFILSGGLTVIWVLVWSFVTSDSPSTHAYISDAEKQYILSSVEHKHDKKKINVPWKSIATSMPFIACLTAHFCFNWTVCTLMTSLPIFMKEALRLDIKQNGLLSSIPSLTQAVSSFLAGQVADSLRSKKILSTTGIRKLFQLTSFIGGGVFLVACAYVNCQQKYITVVFLCISTFCLGLSVGGFMCNHVDLAPKYAGILFGITNTAGTISGMLAPIVAGALTPNQTVEEWRNVFFVCFGFDLFGVIIFASFASGEIQTWATDVNIESGQKSGKQEQPTGTIVINGVENKASESRENEKRTDTFIISGIYNKSIESYGNEKQTNSVIVSGIKNKAFENEYL